MSQGLQLAQKMGLHQVLAPQMLQSLALLQVPTLELNAMVEQELQQNPLLEEVPATELTQDEKETGERDRTVELLDPTEPPADVNFDPATEKPSTEPVDDFQAEFDRLVQLDQEWRDHFSQSNLPVRTSPEDEEKRQFMFDSLAVEQSLQESLLEQVRVSELDDDQQKIAELIVGNIDDFGYLQTSVEELAQAHSLDPAMVGAILKEIQAMQPPGVGARDLRECLMLQLERAGRRDSLEYLIVSEHMDSLGKRRFPEIARKLDLEVEDIQEAAERIGHLEPRPGRAYSAENQVYVAPEVTVHYIDGEYSASLNSDQIPHLRISNLYKDIMSQADAAPEVRDYIREKITAGKFLIKSIHQRQQTILNIARELVRRQRDFMEKGVTHLKPMTMNQIAEIVGVHETTVSRAVSGKYIDTPQGVFEMKYFFTTAINNAAGETMSNTSVKEMVAEIFKKEDPRLPLSDDAVVKLLTQKNVNIARRTVAKYRAELNILPSNLRKVY
jgi:RNA polymerase sigma-54 factor